MGKKNRDKKKKTSPGFKARQQLKPEKKTTKVIKSGSSSELKAELEHLNEINRTNPTKQIRNKQRRRELVITRNSMKKKLKGQLRRKKQKRKEELNIKDGNEDEEEDYDNDEEEEGNLSDIEDEKRIPKQMPQTIESLREKDETFIEENDIEQKEALSNDEYMNYFKGEADPQILLTTSIKHTGSIYRFMREIKNVLPNSYFYYRKKFDIGTIMNRAIDKGFTDIIVITEQLKRPYKLLLIHLPNGPSLEFKIFNVQYQREIEGHGTSAGHNPELLFKNFNTNLGFRLSRVLNSLFPRDEELKGRELVTFHNQRDYIFFRYYRYIFADEFTTVKLQEIGPRFVLKLKFLQKGLYDPQQGEYEWYYKNKMGVNRKKFYL